MTVLILASGSASRQRLLRDAHVSFDVIKPAVDEDAAKAALRADGLSVRDTADALAELKAIKAARGAPPGVLVLGCDQTLEDADGDLVDKVDSRDAAADLLARLSGRAHRLHSASVIVEDGRPVWRHMDSVTMHMRPLTAGFITDYLKSDWDNCRWCVGCYRIEGPGVQLFSRIEGSLFTVQGLALLPLLDYLRTRGVIER